MVIILQTMMGWSPKSYIPSFVEIGQPVPKKNIFKGFLPYMGMAAILVMWPASCHQIYISLYLKASIQNLVQISKVFSEKIRFECLYVHNHGPRSRNQRTSGPVNAHLISWPSKALNIQNLESFHKKFGSDQQSSSWENSVWFFVWTRPSPRSRNNFDL